MVVILAVLYAYSFVDRQIVNLLVNPIGRDLHLSDTRISGLIGVAFALTYTAMSIPAGYLTDRFSRRGLIGGAAVVWSAMTIACGLSAGYWSFFVARGGVGAGEAVVVPASYSLIRDGYAPERRGRAFGIYNVALYLGTALALFVGGALLAAADRGAFARVPLIGGLRPWQDVLVLVGLAGFPLAALSLLLGGERRRTVVADRGASLGEAAAHVRARWPAYALLFAYVTACAVAALGNTAWMPAMIGRKFALAPQQVAPMMGMIVLVCGPAGMLASGALTDWATRRGKDIRLVGLSAATAYAAFSTALPLASGLGATWALYGAGLLVSGTFQVVGAATLAELTPQRHMGKLTGLYLLPIALIGGGFGPVVVALLSDHLFGGPLALARAMSLSSAVFGLAGAACVAALSRIAVGRPSCGALSA